MVITNCSVCKQLQAPSQLCSLWVCLYIWNWCTKVFCICHSYKCQGPWFLKCAHLGILYRGTYCTVSQSMKSRGTIFGGIAYLHDNCAVTISPSHPPAPSIAALEGAGEHFECGCVGVGVGVGVHVRDVCGDSFGSAPILCMCMLFYSVVRLHSIVTLGIGVVRLRLGCDWVTLGALIPALHVYSSRYEVWAIICPHAHVHLFIL